MMGMSPWSWPGGPRSFEILSRDQDELLKSFAGNAFHRVCVIVAVATLLQSYGKPLTMLEAQTLDEESQASTLQ